ncbi:PAS domain S-box protein [Chloracidobacterium validum]|uniref:histidine kinase n=1 Tax=Chloracidobacterium validum TaxID=2821543 RepID=A0ABX8B7Z9_9BACT|nr:PAS domain S-box protein [Chloracidobacterium validum]QUW03068.1 PAS domain S-box protein [Chloracidobacterium validum]
MPTSEQDYEQTYATALTAWLEGQSVAINPFADVHEAAWPPSAEVVRLHHRFMDARRRQGPLAAEVEARAAEFLAVTLQAYDTRYGQLKGEIAETETASGIATWRYDVAQQRLFWSPYALAQMGFDAATAPRTPQEAIAHFVHPADRDYVSKMLGLIQADGQPRELRYRFLHPQHGVTWRLCKATAHRDAQGRVTDLLIFSRNITELVELEERQHLYQAIFDHIEDVVLVTEAEPIDLPGPRIVYVNKAFERMTGYTAEEVIGQSPRILQGPGTSPETRAQIRHALQTWQPITVDILNYRKDGSEFWAELAITPVTQPNGWVTYWVAVQRDITERRRQSARQQHLQKMQAVGELTAGIAHNFNNLLAIIQGYSEILKRNAQDQPQSQRQIETILRAARRGAQLVQQLSLFCRQERSTPVVVDVQAMAEETLTLVRQLLPAEIRVDEIADSAATLKDARPLLIEVDRSQLSQALLNLIINARDAMLPDGGQLTVAVGRQRITTGTLNHLAERVFYDAPPEAGEYVWVSVRDTGIGMDASTQRRIFEPFFTTKPPGQGTGLGLAMVYGFVAEHRGLITVASAPGEGTTLTLYFPAVAAAASNEEFSGEYRYLPLSLPPGATALVVEDERDLCDLIAEMLTKLGFATVHRAYDGAAALDCLRTLDQPLELVVTDYSMPLASGKQVVDELAARGLGHRVLLTSGLPLLDKLSSLPPTVQVIHLPKPVSLSKLSKAVRQLLDDAGKTASDGTATRKPS